MTTRIVRGELWHCPLPMARELHLGPITYTSRDYVVLRLTTSDGVSGVAVGYTRGTPLLEATRTLVGHVIGHDGHEPGAVSRLLRGRFAPGWGAMVRAASLVDIALWDIASRERGVPLPELFGGAEREVPLMAVAGYFHDQLGTEAIVDEVRRFVDEGYRTMKLIVPGYDVSADRALISSVQDVLAPGCDVAIDFHGAFRDVASAERYCREFEDLGLRFIEDPFASYETDAVTELARRLPIPIASGEDVITTATYRQLLMGGVGYLRVDATATGGFTAALAGIEAAGAHGMTAAPHVWPHMHFPLASRRAAVGMVEVIPHYTGSDPLDLVLAEPFPIRDGAWRASDDPGLYLPLDWERVGRFADAHWASDG